MQFCAFFLCFRGAGGALEKNNSKGNMNTKQERRKLEERKDRLSNHPSHPEVCLCLSASLDWRIRHTNKVFFTLSLFFHHSSSFLVRFSSHTYKQHPGKEGILEAHLCFSLSGFLSSCLPLSSLPISFPHTYTHTHTHTFSLTLSLQSLLCLSRRCMMAKKLLLLLPAEDEWLLIKPPKTQTKRRTLLAQNATPHGWSEWDWLLRGYERKLGVFFFFCFP